MCRCLRLWCFWVDRCRSAGRADRPGRRRGADAAADGGLPRRHPVCDWGVADLGDCDVFRGGGGVCAGGLLQRADRDVSGGGDDDRCGLRGVSGDAHADARAGGDVWRGAAVFGVASWQQSRHASEPEPMSSEAAPWSDRLRLSGSLSGWRRRQWQSYKVDRIAGGFATMFGAGTLSGLLGIGSGAVKVLAMDQIMRIPFKVSTTTSNFMIGVTAAASAGIYLHRGYVDPGLAFPVMLGVLAGSLLGAKTAGAGAGVAAADDLYVGDPGAGGGDDRETAGMGRDVSGDGTSQIRPMMRRHIRRAERHADGDDHGAAAAGRGAAGLGGGAGGWACLPVERMRGPDSGLPRFRRRTRRVSAARRLFRRLLCTGDPRP